jgi:hypothetical protein
MLVTTENFEAGPGRTFGMEFLSQNDLWIGGGGRRGPTKWVRERATSLGYGDIAHPIRNYRNPVNLRD